MDADKILREKYLNKLHLPLRNFDGCMMPSTFGRFQARIRNMEVRDDDIWVSSFPKSGTTWIQELIWLVGNDLDYKGAERNQNDRYPYIEITSLLDFKTYKDNHPDFTCPDFLLDPITFVDNLPSPRYIKTHLPWNLLPLQIQNGMKNPKIIHIIRNPKDVTVSFYHHSRLFHGFTGSLEEFFYLFINGKVVYSSYFDNVLSFWNRRQLDNLLILKYEDMQKYLKGAVHQVAEFMDKAVPENEMPRLLKHLSFEEMRKNPAVNFEMLVGFLKESKVFDMPDKKFMRAGKAGNYKEHMTQEMISAMDEWIKTNCKSSGLHFD